MIDVHSHILPGIDDGARTVEETYQMMEEAYNAGFEAIISTSHYMENVYMANKKQKETYIQMIQSTLKQKQIELKVYNGTEVYSNDHMLSLIKSGEIATLNHSRYVLFELPMNQNVIYFDQIIYELISMDYVPIIAHPERYQYVQKNPNMVLKWIEQGALLQVNYGSFIGIYGKSVEKTAMKLLKHNMIHFLGSDCHRGESIYSKIDPIKEKLEKEIGKEKFHKLSYLNPLHIVENEKIEIEEPIKIKGFFR